MAELYFHNQKSRSFDLEFTLKKEEHGPKAMSMIVATFRGLVLFD